MSRSRQLLSKSELAAIAGIKALKRGRATTGEAADILGMTINGVKLRIAQGHLPAFYIGTRQFISLDSLLANGAVLPPPHLIPGAKVDALKPIDLSRGAHAQPGDIYDDD